jgi:benzoyl-CoA reductase/2-hydroxyglutaryl-CoA dehydratase subunit BcrC/BadD/HgdB
MLRVLLDEMPKHPKEQKVRPRLMLSIFAFEHCISRYVDVFQIIDDIGADIVVDDLCFGPRYFWEPVEVQRGAMDALIEHNLGRVPISFRYPCQLKAEKLLAAARSFGVNGAVFIIPKYCTSSLFEYPYIEARFKEKGIPTLMLESNSIMAAQPIKTRLQAFVEMLGGVL